MITFLLEKLVPDFFNKKYMCFIKKTSSFILEFDQSKWLKLYIKFNIQKKKQKKMVMKMENILHSNKHGIYGKTMENMRNRGDVKTGKQQKDYLKWTSKLSFITQKNI